MGSPFGHFMLQTVFTCNIFLVCRGLNRVTTGTQSRILLFTCNIFLTSRGCNLLLPFLLVYMSTCVYLCVYVRYSLLGPQHVSNDGFSSNHEAPGQLPFQASNSSSSVFYSLSKDSVTTVFLQKKLLYIYLSLEVKELVLSLMSFIKDIPSGWLNFIA